MPEQLETRASHVRVTRIHANGGHSTRDVDLRDREQWKRIVRGAKDTIESGGEHHMRPLYQDDGPAISMPSPLKPRVEALEKGLGDLLDTWDRTCEINGWDPDHLVEVKGARDILKRGNR